MSQIQDNISLLTQDDILKGIKLFETEGHKHPKSIFYDFIYEQESFPPKAIVALAYKSKFGVEIETKQFDQGERSKTFKHLKSLGFVVEKKSTELPFRIVLYDVHGESAVSNYNTLKDPNNKIFLWDDKKFSKLKEGDYVFWVNRANSEALFTVLTSKEVKPEFENGKNIVKYKGFTGYANAENESQFPNFNGFDIQEVVPIDEFWNYTDTSTFGSQLMAVNLLVEGIAVKEIDKKIEKLEDLGGLFSEKVEIAEIIEQAISFLGEKRLVQDTGEIAFLEYLSRFDKVEVKVYLDMLRRILAELGVSSGDDRLVFNFYNNGLQFTIGQRYSLVYFPNRKDAKFFVAAKKSIGTLDIDKLFSGAPETFLCRRNELELNSEEYSSVIEALKIELSNCTKSGYRKWNKSGFENFIFSYDGKIPTIEVGLSGVLNDLITQFRDASKKQNLNFSTYLTKRYIASLGTKPFVIFTGLSGSGKTKLAQTFAKWICASDTQYNIIPVGADWTNREPLLGYPNSLDNSKYVLPDNGALDLILAAIENSKDKELKDCNPYFMILDEMNLSHVERYFADFLSAMESKEPISLYSGNERKDENGRVIPQSIVLPSNLFLVGTVNIDETTYMFSPKVLDRANTIEFKVDVDDMKDFFGAEISVSGEVIEGKGVGFSSELMGWFSKEPQQGKDRSAQLMSFFRELQGVGAEFGYRTAGEMVELMNRMDSLGMDATQLEDALDVAVMQKLLPKLHGSRSKLSKVIPILISLCIDTKEQANQDFIKKLLDDYRQQKSFGEDQKGIIRLRLSIAKLSRMHTNAIENGFASFAEG